ncbi:hypothetical protein AKUG0410_13400 [Apilactobacillus kunkeei]|nr:hypothetical protein AKUG0412_13400 [Apilactobacillus kunkeei]CAI2694013.1 hypothetical protein AKUG0410_13400 [Apilactobacillus kunkeei]
MIENKPFYKKGWFISLAVIVVVLFALIGGFIKSANSMATSEQGVEEQLGQVQTVLQRRADLIPNLVNAVKGQQNKKNQCTVTSLRHVLNITMQRTNTIMLIQLPIK